MVAAKSVPRSRLFWGDQEEETNRQKERGGSIQCSADTRDTCPRREGDSGECGVLEGRWDPAGASQADNSGMSL